MLGAGLRLGVIFAEGDCGPIPTSAGRRRSDATPGPFPNSADASTGPRQGQSRNVIGAGVERGARTESLWPRRGSLGGKVLDAMDNLFRAMQFFQGLVPVDTSSVQISVVSV